MTKPSDLRYASKQELESAEIEVRDAEGNPVQVRLRDILQMARKDSFPWAHWIDRLSLFLAAGLFYLAYLVASKGGFEPPLELGVPIGSIAAVACLLGGGGAAFLVYKFIGLERRSDRLLDELDELEALLESKSAD